MCKRSELQGVVLFRTKLCNRDDLGGVDCSPIQRHGLEITSVARGIHDRGDCRSTPQRHDVVVRPRGIDEHNSCGGSYHAVQERKHAVVPVVYGTYVMRRRHRLTASITFNTSINIAQRSFEAIRELTSLGNQYYLNSVSVSQVKSSQVKSDSNYGVQ